MKFIDLVDKEARRITFTYFKLSLIFYTLYADESDEGRHGRYKSAADDVLCCASLIFLSVLPKIMCFNFKL